MLGNSGSWGPGQSLFTINSADNNLARLYATPAFRRMYLRALDELVKGPLDVANSGPLMDAKYNAFLANGLTVENTASIKSWLNMAKASIQVQILAQTGVPFQVNAAVPITDNIATISGVAPVGVKTIWINGIEWPVTWLNVTAWSVAVPLQAGTNVFSIVGVDMKGRAITGASGVALAVFSGAPAPPEGHVVFNEIMFAPAGPNGQFLELYNAAANTAYDLSGWRISEVGYTFPSGTLLRPGRFLVLAQNRAAFAAAYGATIVVFDTFTTPLAAESQKLTLLHPGASGSSEVVTAAFYEHAAPWPPGATAGGISLQLLDPARDNWRAGNWGSATGPAFASPGAVNPVATNLPAFPPVWLNELQAVNLTGITNAAGQHAPWVELYNASTNPVPLEGLFLSDSYSNLANWAFPTGSMIGPGQFRVVFADGQTNLSNTAELHTSFALGAGSGSLALSFLDAHGVPRIIDYLNFTNPAPDHSYGALPDGQGCTRSDLETPTPGVANSSAAPSLSVAINEWMASNTQTAKDPVTGKYEDWFELYNYGETPVDLSGCFLSHSLTNMSEFQIPSGYRLPGHGFLLVWADKSPTNGTAELHADFKLSKSGTSICLRAPGGALIDSVTFGPQSPDLSMGRYPDGAAMISLLPNATPGRQNAAVNTAPALAAPGDKFTYLGQTLSFTAQGLDSDVPRQTLTYSLDPGSPANAAIDSASGVFTWTPTARQAPSTNVFILRATDNGIPPLSASRPFAVMVSPAPALSAATGAGQCTLAWPGLRGQTYQLEYRDDLSSGVWTELGPPMIGTGDVLSLSITNDFSSATQRFFRLAVLP